MARLPQDPAASQGGLFAFARCDAHTHAGIARIFPGEFAFPLLPSRIEHAGVIYIQRASQPGDQPAAVDDIAVMNLKGRVHGALQKAGYEPSHGCF